METTLVVNDVIGNMPQKSGLAGWLLHLAGFAGDHPRVPKVVKAEHDQRPGCLTRSI
jgi:hypothetical protein